MKLNWKEKNKSISRDYIEERLSRLYIVLGEYDKAINLLIKYRNNKNYINNAAKSYIFRTLNLAEELKNVS
ncbi:hypothetical protein [Caloramator quimbayensis]|uniref:hypothetical protein n=1 Tax=Caloramator quimbayensis TaxID=1147123 RepID=UPI00099A0A2D|nr:hypothetical protein [Caloramator quimbayensis]